MFNVYRKIALGCALLGMLVFGAAFVVATLSPSSIESAGKKIIAYQLKKKISDKLEEISSRGLIGAAVERLSKNQELLESLKVGVAKRVMDKVPEIVSEMADPECSCRVTFGRSSANSDEIKLSSLERSVELLTNFVRYKYMETSASLVREFKIFAGANALVFAILLVVVLIKQKAALHLIPPTLILIASAALVAYLYLFQQDWLSTILYSDYVGVSYFAYLGLTFAFLCDILMNRGEITAAILEAVFEATGSVAQVGCC